MHYAGHTWHPIKRHSGHNDIHVDIGAHDIHVDIGCTYVHMQVIKLNTTEVLIGTRVF